MSQRASLVFTLCGLIGFGVGTAETVEPLQEAISVDLVTVDVLVADRDGTPAIDLDREAFRLFEDGREVEIRHFDPPSAAVSAAGSPETNAPVAGRKLVVFVDNLHLSPTSRRRAFAELLDELDSFLEPRDEVMVVDFHGGTNVVLPMTTNRRRLREVLEDQGRYGAINLRVINESQRAMEAIAVARAVYGVTGQTGGDGGSPACRDIGHIADTHAREAHGRVLGTISELESFVGTLSGFDGPKALIHVSDGIPLVPGTLAYRYAAELCDGTGVQRGLANAIDTTTSTGLRLNYWDPTKTEATLRELDTTTAWNRLADQANTYEVSFYMLRAGQPIDRSSSVNDVRTSRQVEVVAQRDREAPLELLSGATGGVAVLNGNQVRPLLEALRDDSRHRYQLAFEPSGIPDGERRALRVEVDRAGAVVRHRTSYRQKAPNELTSDRLLAVLLYGEGDNPLDVTVATRERRSLEREPIGMRVEIAVPIDELVLLPKGATREGLFTVFVAARSPEGQVYGVREKTLPVSVGDDEPSPEAFTFVVDLPYLGPSTEVGVAVRDRIGHDVSFVRSSVAASGS